jgi:hypothetical protein
MTAQLNRSIAALFICGLLIQPAAAETMTSGDGRFSVEIPDVPQFRYQWTDASNKRVWSVSFNGASAPSVAATNREQRYDASVKAVVERLKGMLRIQRPLQIGDVTGREIVVQMTQNNVVNMLRQQMFITDNRFYQVIYTGPEGTETNSDVEAFFKSFQIR